MRVGIGRNKQDIREPDDTIVCMEHNLNKLNLGQIRKVWNNEFKGKK